MNSPFANIYLSLLQQIETLLVAPPGTSPAISYIDLNYGQLDSSSRGSVSFPCVLIDFRDWEFEDLSLQAQKAHGIITLKLATSSYDDTSSISPEATIESGIGVLDLEWQLYNALQGFRPAVAVDTGGSPTVQAQPMSRLYIISDNRHTGVRAREIAFTCAYTDYSAKQAETIVPATINLTEEIDLSL